MSIKSEMQHTITCDAKGCKQTYNSTLGVDLTEAINNSGYRRKKLMLCDNPLRFKTFHFCSIECFNKDKR